MLHVPSPSVLAAIQNMQKTLPSPSVLAAIRNVQMTLPSPAMLAAIENMQKTLQSPSVLAAIQRALVPDPGLLRIVEQSAAATREWSRILEGMAARKLIEHEVLPVLAAHGWLISPSGPASQPIKLHRRFKDGGIDAVDRYLMELLDSEACRAIVTRATRPKTPFARWARTFGKALAALERGDHELSIPIWLAGLEAACLRTFKLKRVYSKHPEITRGAIAIQWAHMSDAYEPLARAWVDVLIGVSGPPRGSPAVLNRHAIMHGDRPLIGTRKDAVQCVLAIEVLDYLWTETKQQTRN
jgi:hypothetical protein